MIRVDPYPWATLPELLKLLGNTVRLEAVQLLMRGPRPVGELARELNLPLQTVSQELAKLRTYDLALFEERGKEHWYQLSSRWTVRVDADMFIATVMTAEGLCFQLSLPARRVASWNPPSAATRKAMKHASRSHDV